MTSKPTASMAGCKERERACRAASGDAQNQGLSGGLIEVVAGEDASGWSRRIHTSCAERPGWAVSFVEREAVMEGMSFLDGWTRMA